MLTTKYYVLSRISFQSYAWKSVLKFLHSDWFSSWISIQTYVKCDIVDLYILLRFSLENNIGVIFYINLMISSFHFNWVNHIKEIILVINGDLITLIPLYLYNKLQNFTWTNIKLIVQNQLLFLQTSISMFSFVRQFQNYS